ncbi:hypothetical protein PHYBOEH_002597 [Phytophthora boehmeriae]|uniref:CCT domain-containing protein n=1 Tax=Phytophthora boehmeriae TaxID=109152 RepID=A0A8T1WQQ3_9STRA|nr:hypothetical protein PHYBOEH_002597 [Phytophthora boehmeriae]
MELSKVDLLDDQHVVNKVSGSPVLMSSRAPTELPQPWELNEVDFLLPSSVGRYCPGIYAPEFALPPDLDDTRPLVFRSGMCWHDMSLSEPAVNEFSPYLVGDVFVDKALPTTTVTRCKMMPPTPLRVNAVECLDRKPFRDNDGMTSLFHYEPSVLSPTMLDKKILVSDSDLKLFSANSSSTNNMRALSVSEPTPKDSPRWKHMKTARFKAIEQHALPSTAPRQQNKRSKVDAVDHNDRSTKRVKTTGQPVEFVPKLDERWYSSRAEDFHGMLPQRPALKELAAHQKTNAVTAVRPANGAQLQRLPSTLPDGAPERRIGIYTPSERRKRLQRFHEKRKFRVYRKRVKYDCRKRLANSCPRIKGRFVRKSEFLQAMKTEQTSVDLGSETSSSSEHRLP